MGLSRCGVMGLSRCGVVGALLSDWPTLSFVPMLAKCPVWEELAQRCSCPLSDQAGGQLVPTSQGSWRLRPAQPRTFSTPPSSWRVYFSPRMASVKHQQSLGLGGRFSLTAGTERVDAREWCRSTADDRGAQLGVSPRSVVLGAHSGTEN